jgi:hypothetical protein
VTELCHRRQAAAFCSFEEEHNCRREKEQAEKDSTGARAQLLFALNPIAAEDHWHLIPLVRPKLPRDDQHA